MQKIVQELKSHNCPLTHYNKGDFIYQKGDEINGVHFLLDGKVKVLGNYKNKKAIMIWLLDSGSFFGLTSYHHDNPKYQYSTEVYSKEASVYHIPDKVLSKLMMDPQFKTLIISSLCSRIDFIEKKLSYSSQVDIKKRLTDLILFLANPRTKLISIPGDENILKYSVSELAHIINTTKYNVRSFLNDLVANKILKYEENGIRILDFQTLKDINQKV